ncbi:hypothetical protein ACA910_019148 [Epithemia clementina (nom. ined.)]
MSLTNTNATTSSATESVSKTLARLLAFPANRSCADCRITMVDSSQVYASYSPSTLDDDDNDDDNANANNNDDSNKHNNNNGISHNKKLHRALNLKQNHEQFAPPGYIPSTERLAAAAAASSSSSNQRSSSTKSSSSSSNKSNNPFDDGPAVVNTNPFDGGPDKEKEKKQKKKKKKRNSSSSSNSKNTNPFDAPPSDDVDVGNSSRDLDELSSTCSNTINPFIDDPLDPALLLRDRGLGHGVFVCAMCGAAHKLMGPGTAEVHAVNDPMAWTTAKVQQLVRTGNAHGRLVLEPFLPQEWKRRYRPTALTGIAERLIFIRAKYEALAFCLPSPTWGADWTERAWQTLLRRHHPEWRRFFKATTITSVTTTTTTTTTRKKSSLSSKKWYALSDLNIRNVHREQSLVPGGDGDNYSSVRGSLASPTNHGPLDNGSAGGTHGGFGAVLPNRLVDFFCVVSAAGQLDPKFIKDHSGGSSSNSLRNKTSVEDFLLVPSVTDCYPKPNAYTDMVFPEHVGYFVFPEGCRPSAHAVSPMFFTFVLTCSDGRRLYGGALKLCDKALDWETLRHMIVTQSGYKGELPPWLNNNNNTNNNNSTTNAEKGGTKTDQQQHHHHHPDIAYLPKCLVVLSHYPFFDLWRKFLLQIYRIALVEAPVPMERFIANFVSEVPLPPPGKIEVRFGFTAQEIWTIQRPPDNELPMADFSFQPLFATLSISSILVVLGCLLQETRVVILSKHYAILTPVAEALLSLMFPLHWHGMYIPIMPYSMLDILEAPMPFLVGMNARYLQQIPPSRRPVGVVFVDLDQDTVHLGWSDEGGLITSTPSSTHKGEPRRTPALPEKDALKLKTRLAANAAAVYLLPDSGKAGCMTYGDEKPLPFGERDSYSRINSAEVPTQTVRRKEFFANVDRAYDENETYTSTDDFLSGQGLFHEKQQERANRLATPNKRTRGFVRRLLPNASGRGGTPASSPTDESEAVAETSELNSTLTTQSRASPLDADEPKGFAVAEIRSAFLRFFVALFKGYRDFMDDDGTFRVEEFLGRLTNITPRSRAYLEGVFRTQMFERFIQERLEDPDDPEVMFFDESVGAKQNSRFLKTPFNRIRNGGKKGDSSFLDDKSKQVTEKFTPPPPSHLGLPDDGRTYHYGSFPELDPALFGKVRQPMMWKEYQTKGASSMRLRASSEVIKKQQSVVNGILGASQVGFSPTSAALSNTAPNTLELALVALSRPYMLSTQQNQKNDVEGSSTTGSGSGMKHRRGSSQGKMVSMAALENPPYPPEEVVLCARRKTLVLAGMFVFVQATARGYLVRTKRHRGFTSVTMVRENSNKGDQTAIEMKLVQNEGEEGTGGEKVIDYEYGITLLQRVVRRLQTRERIRRTTVVALNSQKLTRMYLQRRRYSCLKRGFLVLQSVFRGRRTLFVFTLLRQSVARLQARYRGYFVRTGMHQVLDARLKLYRKQIFILWKRAHTSLAYRTKFWTAIESESFLRHNLAEYELQRLWNELRLIEGMGLLLDEPPDDLARLAARLGLSNSTYIACLTLDESLEVDRDDDFSLVGSIGSTTYSSKSYSAASSGKSFSAASSGDGSHPAGPGAGISFLLNSERTQIYERLSQSSHLGNEQVMRLYETFKIGAKVKKRKKSLAEAVWRTLDHADESAALMYELFPELRNSDTLRFVEPSRKGIRRFRYDIRPVAEFETTTLRAQKLVDDRVRKNVSSVASAGMCQIPVLLNSPSKEGFPTREQKIQHIIGSEHRRTALTKAHAFKTWKHCRLHLMKALVANDL